MTREQPRSRPVVAIDGPSGVGKSTTARLVAERLGFALVDTGALYRLVACVARERGIDWNDGPKLARLTGQLSIELGHKAEGTTRIICDGVDYSEDIRQHEISMGASAVSRHPEVREALLGLQRTLGKEGGVVLEGRDIGTVVFPDAEVKVFLTATAEVRARRRFEELLERGQSVDFEKILSDVKQRDHQDSTRAVAPLRQALDAVLVDSSELSVDDVVNRVVTLVKNV